MVHSPGSVLDHRDEDRGQRAEQRADERQDLEDAGNQAEHRRERHA